MDKNKIKLMSKIHVDVVIKVIFLPNLSVKCPKIGENTNGIIKIMFEMLVFSSPQNISYFEHTKSADISSKHKNPI